MLKVNPKDLSDNEVEEISRAYVRAFVEVIGQDKDIPAPDVYTNSKIMAWMLDEYEKIKGKHEPGMITGKPVELGGLPLRSDSTSKGGFIVLKEFLKKIVDDIGQASESKASPTSATDNKKKSKDIKIAIQGFGNAGMNIAKMLNEEGFKIIAVSDSRGGIMNKNGLEIDNVIMIKDYGKSVVDFEKGDNISNEKLLEMDVDVLILAALENQITKDNVDRIRAKYILELANGPISSDADKILKKRDVVVIPDILANAGGVVASYFEWRSNKENKKEDEEKLENELKKIMINSFEKVWELYEENKEKLSIRDAAYVIAIKRILDAERLRGNL